MNYFFKLSLSVLFLFNFSLPAFANEQAAITTPNGSFHQVYLNGSILERWNTQQQQYEALSGQYLDMDALANVLCAVRNNAIIRDPNSITCWYDTGRNLIPFDLGFSPNGSSFEVVAVGNGFVAAVDELGAVSVNELDGAGFSVILPGLGYLPNIDAGGYWFCVEDPTGPPPFRYKITCANVQNPTGIAQYPQSKPMFALNAADQLYWHSARNVVQRMDLPHSATTTIQLQAEPTQLKANGASVCAVLSTIDSVECVGNLQGVWTTQGGYSDIFVGHQISTGQDRLVANLSTLHQPVRY